MHNWSLSQRDRLSEPFSAPTMSKLNWNKVMTINICICNLSFKSKLATRPSNGATAIWKEIGTHRATFLCLLFRYSKFLSSQWIFPLNNFNQEVIKESWTLLVEIFDYIFKSLQVIQENLLRIPTEWKEWHWFLNKNPIFSDESGKYSRE